MSKNSEFLEIFLEEFREEFLTKFLDKILKKFVQKLNTVIARRDIRAPIDIMEKLQVELKNMIPRVISGVNSGEICGGIHNTVSQELPGRISGKNLRLVTTEILHKYQE